MKRLGVFHLTAAETLWSDKGDAIVLAENEDAAKSCMTCGSDSLLVTVASCKRVGDMNVEEDHINGRWYENAGGYVI
jgi:hypothetical protein